MSEPFDLSVAEIPFVLDAVEGAALLAGRIQSELTEPSLSKRDRSPVTVADFAVQALIGKLIGDAFPGDSLVAEEESSEIQSAHGERLLAAASDFLGEILREAAPAKVKEWIQVGEGEPRKDRFWTLDPIDGTKGFLRRQQYAVALALIVDGRPRIAALGCPQLRLAGQTGHLIVAASGAGAWSTPLRRRRFRKLEVSNTDVASEALVVRSVESGHTDTHGFDLFVRELGTRKTPLLMDSQAKYAILAAGCGDVLLRLRSPDRPNYVEKIWDHAAGSLIVEEAGGKVTDLLGRPLNFNNGRLMQGNVGVAASNGALHKQAIEALQAVSSR